MKVGAERGSVLDAWAAEQVRCKMSEERIEAPGRIVDCRITEQMSPDRC